MLLGGDEIRRSQQGNTNAYCQDNDTSWVDWTFLQRHHEIWRFARAALALRQAHPVLRRAAFYTDEDIQWFNPNGNSPDWFEAGQKCLACLIRGQEGPDLYLMFNADTIQITFVLPPSSRPGPWRLAVDTAQTSPHDCYAPGAEGTLAHPTRYVVASRSSVVLVAR